MKEIKAHKGGCQCGHVRFEIEGELGEASICHCRMCQKASGNYFAPFVGARGTLKWTNEPKRFASSNLVNRGFCDKCGTPLTYEVGGRVSISIGAFDNPSSIKPTIQYGAEGRISYLDEMNQWPLHRTDEIEEAVEFLSKMKSNQALDEN